MHDDPNEARPKPNDYVALLAFLERHNVVKVEVTYNGGHDSGTIEDVAIHRTPDAPAEVPQALNQVWLYDALKQPVWDRYGSWAGEYSAWGALIWDVEEHRIYFEGTESTEEPVSDSVYDG